MFCSQGGVPVAYDEQLARRIRMALAAESFTERKMFGGIAFMLNGNMVCGVIRESFMARVGADGYAAALELPGVGPMNPFGTRAMKGMVMVDGAVIATDAGLQAWVDRCVQFTRTLPAKKK
jgi:TfoX/Sxy family transcriptional regulator of competence genes